MPDGTWKRKGPPIMMVSLDSARQWYPREEFVACNADHSQIAKLKRGENSIYPSVMWAIKKAFLSAGDLCSDVKGIPYDESRNLESADEATAMRRSLLQVTHRHASMPSNDGAADPAPPPSRSLSENAIDQQIRRMPQVKVHQPTYPSDTQSKNLSSNEIVHKWRSGMEVSEWDDTRSPANPTKSADIDMASVLLDEDGTAGKSTELTITLGAEVIASTEAKKEESPDSTRIKVDKNTALQTEDSENSTTGIKSIVMDKVMESAITGGDEAKTRELLAQSYAVNCKDADGITPLHLAAGYKHENIVKLLLEQGAHPSARCNKGRTTLHWLASPSDAPITETLIDLLMRDRRPLGLADGEGITPLMTACQNGRLLLATRLINHGADVRAIEKKGKTALHYAALDGNTQMISLLIDNGAELEAKTSTGSATPLHYAARSPSDSSDPVRQLLLARADKEATTALGDTPLHLAIERDNQACITYLLESGANIEAPGNTGWRPIHLAAGKGQLKTVKALLDRGANIEAPITLGRRPLHVAVYKGQLEIIKALLDHGANPTVRTIKIVGSKPSGISMSDSVSSTQKQAVWELLKDAERTWKESHK